MANPRFRLYENHETARLRTLRNLYLRLKSIMETEVYSKVVGKSIG